MRLLLPLSLLSVCRFAHWQTSEERLLLEVIVIAMKGRVLTYLAERRTLMNWIPQKEIDIGFVIFRRRRCLRPRLHRCFHGIGHACSLLVSSLSQAKTRLSSSCSSTVFVSDHRSRCCSTAQKKKENQFNKNCNARTSRTRTVKNALTDLTRQKPAPRSSSEAHFTTQTINSSPPIP